MAVNLVGMVMQYLTPDRIERIAAAFNLDPKSARSVAEVSVPLLIAELASLAVQPSGAQKVVDAVGQIPAPLIAGPMQLAAALTKRCWLIRERSGFHRCLATKITPLSPGPSPKSVD